MSSPVLNGKLVLITGCTGGIGQASAIALANLGCSLAIHHSSSHSKPKAEALASQLATLNPGIRVSTFQADLSTYPNVDALHREVVEEMGHPDILFANHGATFKTIGPNGDINSISTEMFEEAWRLHTGSTFRLTQLCVPHMEKQKWGRILFTSSVAASTGGVIGPHYASSKSALHGLVHWLSLRYSKEGITSNAIAPALIEDTGMIPRGTDELRSKIPIGRLGKPDEISDVVALLATNGYMTNKIIAVDGGWTSGAM